MPFDVLPDDLEHRGRKNYQDGLSAEDSAARFYQAKGLSVLHRRWRGKAGEVDLIFKDGDAFVFVEVKKSKCFARAAESLSQRQLHRIALAAEEFIGAHATPFADMRLDLAMVDEMGRVDVLENLTLY